MSTATSAKAPAIERLATLSRYLDDGDPMAFCKESDPVEDGNSDQAIGHACVAQHERRGDNESGPAKKTRHDRFLSDVPLRRPSQEYNRGAVPS